MSIVTDSLVIFLWKKMHLFFCTKDIESHISVIQEIYELYINFMIRHMKKKKVGQKIKWKGLPFGGMLWLGKTSLWRYKVSRDLNEMRR